MSDFYSVSTGGFYTLAFHGDSIPSDAVEITKNEKTAILAAQLSRKQIKLDGSGKLVAVDGPSESLGQLMSRAKSELRAMRAPMIDALTGIAGRATRAGNDALAAEADALAVNLLVITDDAVLNAAITYEAMQAAGVAAYKRIAGASSPELAVVFREITGA